ncbi:30S ribosomal protein S17e [archaeon]|jgi:small subunit ribosomal protein S17e|nr:30S ribosomal protein S17e [archaeon]MBT6824023.1 30S ribosomal protein S17e [archaeon]MBT7107256.1 30S ribosomal protein S17e [archaeon]MBT7297177.1 30S ribosomal protein S17e [archaeon]
MGRIKTTMIKRVTLKLFRDHSDEFKTSFDDNKKVIETLADTKSKKLRNIIAGYVTRLKKKEIV